MHARFRAQKAEVILKLAQILTPADEFADVLIEGLNAYFELKRAGGKAGDDFPERFGQPVRNHLEMKKQTGPVLREKKLQERLADLEVQVESPIDEFEL